jgi:hypothetical protein
MPGESRASWGRSQHDMGDADVALTYRRDERRYETI